MSVAWQAHIGECELLALLQPVTGEVFGVGRVVHPLAKSPHTDTVHVVLELAAVAVCGTSGEPVAPALAAAADLGRRYQVTLGEPLLARWRGERLGLPAGRRLEPALPEAAGAPAAQQQQQEVEEKEEEEEGQGA